MIIATVASLLVRIGADTKELEDGLKGASENLKQTGQSMSQLGTTMTKFITAPLAGLGAGLLALSTKTGNYADELLDLEQQTGMSTDALQEYRAVATQAGADQDIVATSAQRLTRELGNIRDGTGSASEALNQLDVDVTSADDSFRSMDDIMPEIISELQGMEDEMERNSLATKIFGRQANELIPVLSMTTDETEQVRNEANELGIVLGRDALEQADDFRATMDMLRLQFQSTMMTLGTDVIPLLQDHFVPLLQDQVAPAISVLVSVVSDLMDWFGKLEDSTQTTVVAFTAFATVFPPILIVAGKLVGAMGTLIGAFGKMLPIIKTVGGAIAGLGVAKLALIGIVGAVAVAIIKNWDWVSENVQKIFNAISNFVVDSTTAMLEWIVDSYNSFVDGMQGILNGLIGIFSTIFRNIMSFVENVNSEMAGFITSAWTGIYDFFNDVLTATLQAFRKLFGAMFDVVGDFVTATIDRIKSWAKALMGILGRFGEGLLNTVTSPLDGMRDRFQRARKDTTKETEKMESDATDNIGSMADVMAEKADEGASDVVLSFEELSEQSIEELERMGVDTSDLTDGLTQDMVDKFEDMGVDIVTVAEQTTDDTLLEWQRMYKGTETIFDDMGSFIAESTGLMDSILGEKFGDMSDESIQGVVDLKDNILPLFKSMEQGTEAIATDLASGVIASLTGIPAPVVGEFIGMGIDLLKHFGLWEGFKDTVKAVSDFVVGAVRWMGRTIRRIFGGLFKAVKATWDAIAKAITTAIDIILAPIRTLISALERVAGFGRRVLSFFGLGGLFGGNSNSNSNSNSNNSNSYPRRVPASGNPSNSNPNPSREVNITQNFNQNMSREQVQMATERAMRKTATDWTVADGRIL